MLDIQPILDVIARLDRRTQVASERDAAAWADVPVALRDRAFFSARVTQADLLAEMQRRLSDSVAMRTETTATGQQAFVDRSSFIGDMRKLVLDLDLSDGSGELTDLASAKRLGLVFDQNTREAFGFARAKSANSAGALAAFPAQELVRVESRTVPRDWASIWATAGGRFYGGRMIALTTDPIWTDISRFGNPWPPFDYGSGMGVIQIDRDEAVALGVIAEDEQVEPVDYPGFNDQLEVVDDLPPAMRDALVGSFDGQLVAADGKLRWQRGGQS